MNTQSILKVTRSFVLKECLQYAIFDIPCLLFGGRTDFRAKQTQVRI